MFITNQSSSWKKYVKQKNTVVRTIFYFTFYYHKYMEEQFGKSKTKQILKSLSRNGMMVAAGGGVVDPGTKK